MELTTLSAYEQAVERLEQTGHYVCFEYLGASVGFYSDEPEAASVLSERFAGYFSTTDDKMADSIVYGCKNDILFDQLYSAAEISSGKKYAEFQLDDTRSLIFDRDLRRTLRTENICYVLDRSERKLLISYNGAEKNRRALTQRVIRNLIRLQMLEKGWVHLVAASFEKDGVGFCIIGDKKAGKTSTLINQLSYPGTKLIGTNRVFLRDTGSSLEVCGFPHAASIRIGTVLAHPQLQLWLDRATDSFYEQASAEEMRKIAATTPLNELNTRPEKVSLMPGEVVELFNTSIATTAPLKAFLSVQFDPERDDASMVSLEGDQALIAVAGHYRTLYFERQTFLQQFFTITDELLVERLIAILTKYLSAGSVQELAQGAHTNDQAEALICELARTIESNAEMLLV